MQSRDAKYTISLTYNPSPVLNSAIKVPSKIINCNFFRLRYCFCDNHLRDYEGLFYIIREFLCDVLYSTGFHTIFNKNAKIV